jgi:hypothetical protein
MKHRLPNAARMANLDSTGGAAEIVMDPPLYPVHRFAALLARFAASLRLPGARSRSVKRIGSRRTANISKANFYRISKLKCRRTPPIQSRRETGFSHR